MSPYDFSLDSFFSSLSASVSGSLNNISLPNVDFSKASELFDNVDLSFDSFDIHQGIDFNLEDNADLLLKVGLGVGAMALFCLGNLWGRYLASVNNQKLAEKIEQKLLVSLMDGGWRPKKIDIGGVSFFISYFKPAITGSVAIPVVKTNDDKSYLLLNLQKRTLKDGQQKAVIDFPRGFYQADEIDLAFKQILLNRVAKAKSANVALSSTSLKAIIQEIHQEIKDKTLVLDKLSADKSVVDTAIRKLEEETGQKGLVLTESCHFASAIVETGEYLYHFVELTYQANELAELTFSPETEEGVISSYLVELKKENFQFELDENKTICGKVKVSDNRWLEIKPYDNNANVLASYLSDFHDIRYDDIQPHLNELSAQVLDSRYQHQKLNFSFSL